ncbi:hypothetical protein HPG69_012818 [Diceros bicornis minor]|uniref:Uncharacterized protein n=1 Tax=Diceros bicornis minor TaxID=77932 RepID=A0A7J7F174_DICBM|nr:hypothetical protein HPG69_012818 [Diceros bicornis minor]
MRSACLALKHSKHQLSPTKSSTICLCHKSAQIKHKLSQQKACLLGKNAKAAQELPQWTKSWSVCLDFCFQKTAWKQPLRLAHSYLRDTSNAKISLMLCSPTAMKQTMFDDVMVTAVLSGQGSAASSKGVLISDGKSPRQGPGQHSRGQIHDRPSIIKHLMKHEMLATNPAHLKQSCSSGSKTLSLPTLPSHKAIAVVLWRRRHQPRAAQHPHSLLPEDLVAPIALYSASSGLLYPDNHGAVCTRAELELRMCYCYWEEAKEREYQLLSRQYHSGTPSSPEDTSEILFRYVCMKFRLPIRIAKTDSDIHPKSSRGKDKKEKERDWDRAKVKEKPQKKGTRGSGGRQKNPKYMTQLPYAHFRGTSQFGLRGCPKASHQLNIQEAGENFTFPSKKRECHFLAQQRPVRRRDSREDTESTRRGTLHRRALTNRAGGTARAPNEDSSGEPRRRRVSPARPAGRAQMRRRHSVRGAGLRPLRELRRQREKEKREDAGRPAAAFSRPSAGGGGR